MAAGTKRRELEEMLGLTTGKPIVPAAGFIPGGISAPVSDGVYRPDPGALASMGVRKMDPAAMGAPGYEPTLAVPAAATPSGLPIRNPRGMTSAPTPRPLNIRSLTPEEAAESEAIAKAGPDAGFTDRLVSMARAVGRLPIPGAIPPPPEVIGSPPAGPVKTPPPTAPPPPAAPAPAARSSRSAPQLSPEQGENIMQMLRTDGRAITQGLAGTSVAAPAGDSDGPMGQAFKLLMGGAGAPRPQGPTDFQRAQEAASGNRLIAGLAQAGATAIGRGDEPGLKALAENADRPLADLQMERGETDRAAGEDPASPQSQMARQLLAQMVPGIAEQPWFAGLSAARANADPMLKMLLQSQQAQATARGAAADRAAAREDQQAFQRNLAEGNWANARAIAAMTQGNKAAQTREEREVGGLEIAAGRLPTKQDAEELKKGVTSVNVILNDLDRMSDVYARQGAEFGFGADRNTSVGSRENIILKLKELENLGVLQKVDVDTLSKVIPNPNSLGGVFDQAGTKATFDNFNKQLRETIGARAQARGYQVPAGSRLSAPPSGAASGMVRVSNGQETLDIPAADVAEAERDGFRRVQ